MDSYLLVLEVIGFVMVVLWLAGGDYGQGLLAWRDVPRPDPAEQPKQVGWRPASQRKPARTRPPPSATWRRR